MSEHHYGYAVYDADRGTLITVENDINVSDIHDENREESWPDDWLVARCGENVWGQKRQAEAVIAAHRDPDGFGPELTTVRVYDE